VYLQCIFRPFRYTEECIFSHDTLSDSREDGEALSSVHSTALAAGKLMEKEFSMNLQRNFTTHDTWHGTGAHWHEENGLGIVDATLPLAYAPSAHTGPT